jgi:aminobutyraldehyde dehydrogenase
MQMRLGIWTHGGLKSSGYGKDLSMYALEDYTVARHVMVKL